MVYPGYSLPPPGSMPAYIPPPMPPMMPPANGGSPSYNYEMNNPGAGNGQHDAHNGVTPNQDGHSNIQFDDLQSRLDNLKKL